MQRPYAELSVDFPHSTARNYEIAFQLSHFGSSGSSVHGERLQDHGAAAAVPARPALALPGRGACSSPGDRRDGGSMAELRGCTSPGRTHHGSQALHAQTRCSWAGVRDRAEMLRAPELGKPCPSAEPPWCCTGSCSGAPQGERANGVSMVHSKSQQPPQLPFSTLYPPQAADQSLIPFRSGLPDSHTSNTCAGSQQWFYRRFSIRAHVKPNTV